MHYQNIDIAGKPDVSENVQKTHGSQVILTYFLASWAFLYKCTLACQFK